MRDDTPPQLGVIFLFSMFSNVYLRFLCVCTPPLAICRYLPNLKFLEITLSGGFIGNK